MFREALLFFADTTLPQVLVAAFLRKSSTCKPPAVFFARPSHTRRFSTSPKVLHLGFGRGQLGQAGAATRGATPTTSMSAGAGREPGSLDPNTAPMRVMTWWEGGEGEVRGMDERRACRA